MTVDQPQTKMKTMRKAAFIASGLFAAILIFFVLAYTYLMSPGVQKRIVASIRDPLARGGVVLDLEDIRLDVFAGLNFHNLKLKINRPPHLDAELAIAKMRLSYSFWGLLNRRLELKDATIDGVRGVIKIKSESREPPDQASSFDLQGLLDLLRKPPIEVLIPTFNLKDMVLDLRLETPGKNLRASLDRAEVEASIKILPGNLEVKTGALFGAGLHFENHNAINNKTIALSIKRLTLNSDGTLIALTTKDAIDWKANLKPSSLTFETTSFKSMNEDQILDLSLNNARITSEGNLEKVGQVSSKTAIYDFIGGTKARGKNQINVQGLKIISGTQELSLGRLGLSQKSEIALAADLFSGLHDLTVNQKFNVENVSITNRTSSRSAPSNNLTLPKLAFDVRSSLKAGIGSVEGKSSLERLMMPTLKQPISIEQNGEISVNLPNDNWLGKAEVSLNGTPALSWSGNGTDADGKLHQAQEIRLQTHEHWSSSIPQLLALEALGWPTVNIKVDGNLRHTKLWREFKPEDAAQLSGDIVASIVTRSGASFAKSPKRIIDATEMTAKVNFSERDTRRQLRDIKLDVRTLIKGVRSKLLTRDAALQHQITGEIGIGERVSGTLTDQLTVNNIHAATSEFTIDDRPKIATITHKITAEVTPKLIDAIGLAKPIPHIGSIKLLGEHRVQVKHGQQSLISPAATTTNRQTIRIDASGEVSQAVSQADSMPIVRLERPFNIKAGFDLLGTQIKGGINYHSGDFLISGAALRGLKGKVELVSSGSPSDPETSMALDTSLGRVDIYKTQNDRSNPAEILGSINGLYLKLNSSIRRNTQLIIDKISAGTGGDLIKMTGQGQMIIGGSGQFDGIVESHPSATGELVTGSGTFEMPFKIKKYDQHRIALQAEPTFNGFSAKIADFEASLLNGSMRVSEDLRVDNDGTFGFLYLRTQTPFARVDYENIEPFVSDTPQLKIGKLAWKHVEIGPIEQSFDISQNLILLNDLRMNLLAGNAVGRGYLDLHPARFRLGFVGRFSGVKPELLKAQINRAPEDEWAELGGRAAVNFDLRKRLAAGRIDLTSIGKKQLLSLLDAVDPANKDDKIALVKQGLSVAYPRKVGIVMDQGLMDIDVTMRGAVSQDFKIRSLPLTGFINSMGGEALHKLDYIID